jgi:hypothetical protein
MAMPRKVAPSGLPTSRSRMTPGGVGSGVRPSWSLIAVLSRKSWAMPMPMEAKASEVRSQARKVRSDAGRSVGRMEGRTGGGQTHPARDGRAQRCPCCRARRCHTYPPVASTSPMAPRR